VVFRFQRKYPFPLRLAAAAPADFSPTGPPSTFFLEFPLCPVPLSAQGGGSFREKPSRVGKFYNVTPTDAPGLVRLSSFFCPLFFFLFFFFVFSTDDGFNPGKGSRLFPRSGLEHFWT